MDDKINAPRKPGRPRMGAAAKVRINVMLDPRVAARLRSLGGGNLSCGIELAALSLQTRVRNAGRR